jgi:hypothetical protein
MLFNAVIMNWTISNFYKSCFKMLFNAVVTYSTTSKLSKILQSFHISF